MAKQLTGPAKAILTLAIVTVAGFGVWKFKGDQIKCWSNKDKCKETAPVGHEAPADPATASSSPGHDFDGVARAPADPDRQARPDVTRPAAKTGKLARPLVVAINTWAGHAPGIVAAKAGIYKRLSLNIDFKLIEEPPAKLAAFQSGQIDIMWDTVDSWAREASVLAEGKVRGRAILMEDWSRGGDGVVAVEGVKSVEDLAGKRVATTEYTPSHWLLLYLLSQSGLTSTQKDQIEKSLVITQAAADAAAAFKAGQVDAAVTWEPDLSGAVKARKGAHILVSTTAATNVIADVLVVRQELIDKAPETLNAFVAGWFQGIDFMKHDPANANAMVGDYLKLATEEVEGMLSGLKLTAFADNAQFFGLTSEQAHFETLFTAAFKLWRKRGVVTKSVDAADHLDTSFVASQADTYRAQRVEEPKLVAKAASASDVPILNKTLSINFTPGSDQLMPGSEFVLDSLGETMTSFGQTYLNVEGNTDSTGSRPLNVALSARRAATVVKYLVSNFKVDEARFRAIGNGPDKPIAPNTTEAGQQINRRTDIKVVLATVASN